MIEPHTGQHLAASEVDRAFETFYLSNTPHLVAFLILQGAGLADAADIAQDTMSAAYRRWHSIDHPRPWIYRVASRALIRRMMIVHETPVADPPEPCPLLQDDAIERWEQHQDIASVIANLPPRQRQVMAWTLADYSPTEIATELGITPEAVRANLLKARRALRNHLSDKEGR